MTKARHTVLTQVSTQADNDLLDRTGKAAEVSICLSNITEIPWAGSPIL
jgi:hypothetical protein